MEFGRLEDVRAREAWPLEARAFTPWLSENLERLGTVLGIDLAAERVEAPVGRFAADIVARNVQDDSVVLIENQLECSDHTHLGQILTYLTGLQAQTIVWVAPEFRDEHLSAIGWLNENTVAPYAFFAVRLRVVKIGDSALAPLFEVISKPNNWDRTLAQASREAALARETSPLAMRRRAFWTWYRGRFADTAEDVVAGGGSSRWRPVAGTDLFVAQWLSVDGVGVFVRGGRGVDGVAVIDRLRPIEAVLRERLGADLTHPTLPLVQRMMANTQDEAVWEQVGLWMHERAVLYQAVLAELMSEPGLQR